MASGREYLEFITDQLSGLPGVSHRAMMGEYVLYYRGKVFGGIYDDRLLVKDTPAARRLMPRAELALPYPGAKPMLAADCVEDRDLLTELVAAMYAELPEPRRKGVRL